jgi:hypothetical protein
LQNKSRMERLYSMFCSGVELKEIKRVYSDDTLNTHTTMIHMSIYER